MRFQIDIDYPREKMAASRRRLEARGQYRCFDRVPVAYCLVPRYFAPLFDLPYLDFFRDADTQFYWQLQFAKYRIENIPEDFCTSPEVVVHPYFDNVIPPSAHGADIGWTEGGPPRAVPTIHTVGAMENYQPPSPEAGLRGKSIQWWHRMNELAHEARVTFCGQEGRVVVSPLSLAGLSPHMIAVDLVGADFYWWVLECPEACHRFLDRITQAEIESETNTRRLAPRPPGPYGIAEDSAQILSPALFRQFCVPYTNRIFECFAVGGRSIHMCGDSTHLLALLRDEVKMTSFDLFGYLVEPTAAAQALGGRSLLWGNLNPMLMQTGRPDEVGAAARDCLDALGPCGGLLLGDGANVCPGTPLESFHAVMRAAEEYGVPPGRGLPMP